MVGITDDLHRAAVLAEGGDPKDTVAGISPNRFRGCRRKSVPAVCPLRPRGTALVASSPLRNVAPRCGFGSGYGQGTGIDVLAAGNCLLRKEEQEEKLKTGYTLGLEPD